MFHCSFQLLKGKARDLTRTGVEGGSDEGKGQDVRFHATICFGPRTHFVASFAQYIGALAGVATGVTDVEPVTWHL